MTVAYASMLVPKFVYTSNEVTIDSTNNKLVFAIGGGAITATITSGTYFYGELAQYVKLALETADATGTYTCTYSYSTFKFTITRSAGTFSMDVGGSSFDILPTLGFTSDKSAALTYTSDVAVPSSTTVTCTQRIIDPQVEEDDNRQDTRLESGRQESAYYGCTERITFRLEFESTAVVQALRSMWRGAGRYGIAVSFYPDSTNAAYITVILEPKSFRPRQMSAKRVYRRWDVDFALLVRVPAGGTLTAADFDDRRPNT